MTVLFRRLASSFIWIPPGSRGGSHHPSQDIFWTVHQIPRVADNTRRSTRQLATSESISGDTMFSIEELSCLAGIWKGEGSVLKSTGEQAATYQEQAEFKPVRKTDDFVVYRHTQETQHAVKNMPMHTETGFLKVLTDGTAVASFAHPFPSGFIDEMSQGALERTKDGTMKLTLKAKDFQRAVPNPQTGKKQVQGFQRVYTLDGDGKLSYKQYLSTDKGGDNLYHHLTCTFTKQKE
uniref:THAP4-like heme-binding domain-containing protein n=1 Tax=Amphora coffeiformis TaxID=265554 RepID=A0A7S3LHB0_9STRA